MQLYIAGESYAGQHIPYIARGILDRNARGPKQPWNLQGLLIGNGWISPTDQYLSYLPFAYKAGLVQGGTGHADQIEKQQAICVKALDAGAKDHVDDASCEQILQDILRLTRTKQQNGGEQCVNMYDVRLRDSYPSCGMSWPPDLKHVTPYLGRKDVIQALHIDPGKSTGWTECNGAVGSQFRAKNSRPAVELLPGLLEQVPIILFSGDQDLICNHVGTEELINNLHWNNGTGFEISPGQWAPRRDWTFEGEPAGIYQEARNLTYVLFYNSSHMVPFDYARRSRDMLDRFMGVDIGSIGGQPADSRIDGEKGLETSVGGHPNSTAAEEQEKQKLQEATWRAYYKSGEVALVFVAIAAALWGWFVWRDRRRRAGYQGVFGGSSWRTANGREGGRESVGLESFRQKTAERDVEAADFDENELEDLGPRKPGGNERRYSLGDASSDEESDKHGKNADGHR